MSSQVVLWIAIVTAALLAMLFLRRKGQKEPSRLRLVSKTGKAVGRVIDPAAQPRSARRPREYVSPETVEAASEGARIKSLNVIFNYNGHSWDAYEVLGVPAGAPLPMVKAAYDKALRENASESHSFLQAAFHAIQKN